MENKTKYVYAVARTKEKNSMVGQSFPTREEAKKHLPLYEKKGWTGGIVRLEAPKQLSKEEQEQLTKLSRGLNEMVRKMI